MRKRWFHQPEFHIPKEHVEKKASWLELFYDLIFVAAFIQLGNGLSSTISWTGFLTFSAMFSMLWTIWTGFTTYINRFNIDDFLHRFLIFLQMLSVGSIAIFAPQVFDGNDTLFSISIVFSLFIICLLYLRSFNHEDKNVKAFARNWSSIYAVSIFIWLISLFFSSPLNYVFWGIGTSIIFLLPLSKTSRHLSEFFPRDREHLSERYGILTIIVLGESFVKVLSVLNSSNITSSTVVQIGIVILLTISIWWIYFDDVAGSDLKKGGLNSYVWLYSHLPFQLSVTAFGVAAKKLVTLKMYNPIYPSYAWLLCGVLALAFLSVAAIDSVTERRQSELNDDLRVNVRLLSGLVFFLLPLISQTVSAKLFLAIVLILAIMQVLFDMAMAPIEEVSKHTETFIGEKMKVIDKDSDPSISNKQREIEVIRKGSPNEFKKDFYYFLMEGSWLRLFLAIGFSYFIINVIFAIFYILEPNSITDTDPNSFLDSFFFSVQTFSTIGYGTMSPVNTYSHIIVTIEAMLGLIFVALSTGLIFTKASRPKASIMFSDPIVVNRRNGKHMLMFRVGNARGNNVVDAKIDVNVLIDEFSKEGDHIRRFHPLKLVSSRSPIFKMSWTVMHEIDEDSPLSKVDWNNPEKSIISFISTIQAHDLNYAQTIYDRHIYYPFDIKNNEVFLDVISQLPDKRWLLDFETFNKTKKA